MISADGLHKRYGGTEALRGIDLDVPAGTVLGLLGRNGAGKTTAVRILTTLVKPDAGTARVAGFDVVRDARRVRERIGLTGQSAALDDLLTGRGNLEMVGQLRRLSRQEARRRATQLLEQFDLTAVADRAVKTYSGGTKRRLDLAAGFIGDPDVLFLDEPTTGLDPQSRRAMWDAIGEVVDRGVTILLTTQYLEEADQLADRIVVIDQGRVRAEGSPDELKRQLGGDRLHVTVAAEHVDSAVIYLRRLGEVAVVDGEAEPHIEVVVGAAQQAIPEAVTTLASAGIAVESIEAVRPSLDDVFVSLIGDGAASPVAETLCGEPT